MEVRASAAAANQVQFKAHIDNKNDQNDAQKTSDRNKHDDSQAVNKSNADKRAAKIAAERGGVDIRA